jgi:predicted glycoside hydrolase/deacetylase ChbG (UPF0249 family)
MTIPANIIANADDLGCSAAVNKGILYSFEQGYVNSTSLLVNSAFFDETVDLIHQNPVITHIGLHINMGEFKPVSNFSQRAFLDENGDFDIYKIKKKYIALTSEDKAAISKEIYAQIDKALANKIPLTHIDSHCHLHTLPFLYKFFLDAAKHYKLKLRLAQTYFNGSYLNFYYRKYINNIFKKENYNYSDYFEDMAWFFRTGEPADTNHITEIMVHPYLDESCKLSDLFNVDGFEKWIGLLNNQTLVAH